VFRRRRRRRRRRRICRRSPTLTPTLTPTGGDGGGAYRGPRGGSVDDGETGQGAETALERGMVRLAVFLVVLFAACAAGSATQLPPATPASAAAMGPPGGDPLPDAGAGVPDAADRAGIEADFGNAKAKFDEGNENAARAALESFVARYPNDSARPAADVLLARLALMRGEPAAAKALLEPMAGGQ